MTREEAKIWLNKLYTRTDITNEYGDMEDMQPYEEALDMAIKTLEQEPCDDCISRQAMHIELEKWITYGEYKYSNATKYLYDRIDRLPSVSPQQKMGRWIIDRDSTGRTYGECSECMMRQYAGTLNYCPDCGARMEAGE